ncbi:MAG: hypothetical protein LBB21_02655 [Holosporaceae bacterium]|jgi:hypothetical protein|nr:hypothetical protein [Holosporaceae bacterium]
MRLKNIFTSVAILAKIINLDAVELSSWLSDKSLLHMEKHEERVEAVSGAICYKKTALCAPKFPGSEYPNEKIVIIGCSCSNSYGGNAYNIGDTFTDDTVVALNKIVETSVGRRLLKDTIELTEAEERLVILQTNILDHILFDIGEFNEASSELDKYAEIIHKRVPEALRKYMLYGGLPSGKKVIALRDVRNYNCFSPKLADSWSNHTIFLGKHKQKTMTFDKAFFKVQTPIVQLNYNENDLIRFDITLFHEINHYRHYKQKLPTFDFADNSKLKNTIGGEFASLPLFIMKKTKSAPSTKNLFSPRMTFSEEELQLTGYTNTKDNEILRDPVNEMYYRLQSGSDSFRYPYSCDGLSDLYEYSVSASDIIRMLREPLNKSAPSGFKCDTSID